MSRITPLAEGSLGSSAYDRIRRQVSVTVLVPAELHPDSKHLIMLFAEALADKLRAAEIKHFNGQPWNAWLRDDWRIKCQRDMIRHLAKGDPRDVAIYCAFMWARDWSIDPAADSPLVREALGILMSSFPGE